MDTILAQHSRWDRSLNIDSRHAVWRQTTRRKHFSDRRIAAVFDGRSGMHSASMARIPAQSCGGAAHRMKDFVPSALSNSAFSQGKNLN